MYEYRATLIRVVDGDTVDMLIDLGLETFKKERLRLAEINAPELRGKERELGRESKAVLEDLLTGAKELKVRTIRTKRGKELEGKYGRYIAHIIADGVDASEFLVERGCAVYKSYK